MDIEMLVRAPVEGALRVRGEKVSCSKEVGDALIASEFAVAIAVVVKPTEPKKKEKKPTEAELQGTPQSTTYIVPPRKKGK